MQRYDPTEAYLVARTSVGPGEDDCWLWTLKPDRDGYGVAHLAGRQWRAHRLSYTHYVGPIPDGHDLDHTCENRICVRPSHLEPVTNLENFVRKYLRQGRTREEAEKLAAFDREHVRREQEFKVKNREKRQAAAAAGVVAGTVVRRTTGRSAALWVVEEVRPSHGETVWLKIKSKTSGREELERV